MAEWWVRRALEHGARGEDLLLTGQSPLGEILACPSAVLLDRIAVCLVDVEDSVRRERLAERDPGKWTSAELDAYLGWAAWQRAHAEDPRHRPGVLIEDGWPPMRWDRWSDWTAGDARWRTHRLDTTGRTVAESAAELAAWVRSEREGRSALVKGWDAGLAPSAAVEEGQ